MVGLVLLVFGGSGASYLIKMGHEKQAFRWVQIAVIGLVMLALASMNLLLEWQ